MTFGQRLRELRKAKGLSQRALASKVGISFTYLSKLETGIMPSPGQKTILALSEALEADTDEIFNLAGKIPPDIFKQLNIDTIKGLRSRQNQSRQLPEPSTFEIDRINSWGTQKEQKKFFQALIENSSDGVVVLSDKLAVIYENPSAARILGYKPGEFTGADLYKLLNPDDAADMFSSFTRLMEKPDEIIRNEVRYRHKGGTWHIIESIGVSLPHNPRIKGIVITFRDITERGQEKSLSENVAEAMAKDFKLTEGEHKVLMLMVEGQSNPQIAEQLVLSASTVRFHVSNILFKLGVSNRTKAVALATKYHLVD